MRADETPASPTCSCIPKRKAEDSEDEDNENTQIPKKRRAVHGNDTSSSGPSPFASIHPTEPLSINDILRQRCRERLYVTPLHWKIQHLELLGCRFNAEIETEENANDIENAGDVGTTQSPQGQLQDQVANNTTKLPPHAIVRQAASRLSSSTLASAKSTAIQDILEECGMARDTCSTLNFYFNNCGVAILRTEGVFLRTSYESQGPSLAFLNLRSLGVRRDKSIRPRHVKEDNSPGYNIRQKRRSNIRPENQVEDPYIAAVLIPLAQEQQHQQDDVTMRETSTLDGADTLEVGSRDYKVFVLALSTEGKPSLYFYTAGIPSSFLGRLDNPSLNVASRPFRIKYHRIPLSPITAMKRALKFAVSVIHGDNYAF